MRCKHCNEKVAEHDLWCVSCGKKTEVLDKDLSAINSLRSTWRNFNPNKGNNFAVGTWGAFTGILPMLIILFTFYFILPEMTLLNTILLYTITWTIFLPVLVIPVSAVCHKTGYQLCTTQFTSAFNKYFDYLLFSLISALFYIAIFFICKGDPILNLVWLVLVIYWVAIVYPLPVLMERYKINAWKALKLSYRFAGDIRWNIFLLGIVLALINILAIAFLFVGLIVTLPFTWYVIRDYVDKMIEFEVFETKDNK